MTRPVPSLLGVMIAKADEQRDLMRHARSRSAYLVALVRRQVALDTIAGIRDGRIENVRGIR